jgi:hypothetical protein
MSHDCLERLQSALMQGHGEVKTAGDPIVGYVMDDKPRLAMLDAVRAALSLPQCQHSLYDVTFESRWAGLCRARCSKCGFVREITPADVTRRFP